jgi:hypothetical protein
MGGTGVFDRFLAVFIQYIDSGFGLLGGKVAFIATTLIVIDVTLAALIWSWGADDDIIARLVKKTFSPASSPTTSPASSGMSASCPPIRSCCASNGCAPTTSRPIAARRR